MKSYLSSFELKKNCACESKSLAKGGKNQEGNNPLSSLEGTDIAPPCHRVPVETSFPSLILMIKVIWVEFRILWCLFTFKMIGLWKIYLSLSFLPLFF